MTYESPEALPIAVVIPTRNRPDLLAETLRSLMLQSRLPAEVVVVDASDEEAFARNAANLKSRASSGTPPLRHMKAAQAGAAPQRNQGVEASGQPMILFLDDDIRLSVSCLERLHAAMQADDRNGGVSAMISNAAYRPPGAFSKRLFHWFDDRGTGTYAGRCLGPGLTTMPSDHASLPEVTPMEWLITGCTLYRRAALPAPPFSSFFHDASIGEDLALSLEVGRRWKLANARLAKVEHLGAVHSHCLTRECELAEMELVNRHHIMTEVLKRTTLRDYVQFLVMEFGLLPSTLLQRDGWRRFPVRLWGRLRGLRRITTGGSMEGREALHDLKAG